MKRLLLPLFMVVTACTADAIDVDCGQGTQVIIDDENFCVFKQSVVIENGFDCPPMMPFLTPADGFGVCGSRGQLPDDLIDRIGQEFPDAEVPIPDNNSANNSANNSPANNLAPTCSVTQDCSVGQVCINGECVPEGSCTSNDTCAQGEFCAFASGTCGADPGVCQSRGDTCIDLFDPVCGCDGQTYSNACYAGLAGVSVEFAGACE
jgi:hypothetical protein